MPEGDSLHRAAGLLRALEGDTIAAEARHPRAVALRVAEAVDGRRLERVEALGKHLLLRFDGGLVLRSHLGMKGRWSVEPAGTRIVGSPWLVLRGEARQAVLRGGSSLALGRGRLDALGPDVMESPPDLDGMLARFRASDQTREIGEVVLDQRVVAGIGNMWKAEGLFRGGVSPWSLLRDVPDDALRRVLAETASAMHGARGKRSVYRRARRPCRRCGTAIEAWPQGEAARTAYWCPACQPGPEPRPGAFCEGGTKRVRA